jgi:putative spermidine/putrescine transport system permease protein
VSRGRASALLLPALLFYLALFVAGHVGVFQASLTYKGSASLANYAHFLSNPFFRTVLERTLLVSLWVTALTLLVGFPIAVYLARPGGGRGRTVVIFAVVSPMLMSAVARSYGWIIILGPNGLLQRLEAAAGLSVRPLLYTQPGMIIALTHVFLPFMVLAITGSLQRIDPAIERAAEILGAGALRRLLRITLPLSVPGILSGALIVFCLSASSFVKPALVGGTTIQMMSYVVYNQGLMLLDWPFAAAVAVILLLTTALVAATFTALGSRWQRHLQPAR